MEVTAGDAVCLKCQVAGTPEIKVSWFKADGKVRSSPTCKLEYSKGVSCLKLSKATKSDIGQYTCKAENAIGSASSTCRLNVLGKTLFPCFPEYCIYTPFLFVKSLIDKMSLLYCFQRLKHHHPSQRRSPAYSRLRASQFALNAALLARCPSRYRGWKMANLWGRETSSPYSMMIIQLSCKSTRVRWGIRGSTPAWPPTVWAQPPAEPSSLCKVCAWVDVWFMIII